MDFEYETEDFLGFVLSCFYVKSTSVSKEERIDSLISLLNCKTSKSC